MTRMSPGRAAVLSIVVVLSAQAFRMGASRGQTDPDFPPPWTGQGWVSFDNVHVGGCFYCHTDIKPDDHTDLKCLTGSGQKKCTEREMQYNGEVQPNQCFLAGDLCNGPADSPGSPSDGGSVTSGGGTTNPDDEPFAPGSNSFLFSVRQNACDPSTNQGTLIFRNVSTVTSSNFKVSFTVPEGVNCTSPVSTWTVAQAGRTCTYTPPAVAFVTSGPLISMRYGTSSSSCVTGQDPVVFDTSFTCTAESDAHFCARVGATCGTATGIDNCGAARSVSSCGSCSTPLTCGGGGVPGLCGLAPLSPVADAYVREGEPTTNFGTDPALLVKDQDSDSTNTRRAFLRFSVAGLPAAVAKATLRVYGSRTADITQDAAYAVSSNSWTETGVTWNNRPSVGQKLGQNVSITSVAQYYEFDVTSFVAAQVESGQSFVSLAILPETTTDHAPDTFNSKEATANRPQLVIQLASLPIADTYVENGSPDTTFGTSTTLLVKNQPGSGNIRRSFLMFDLAQTSKSLSSAKLRLYGNHTTSTTADAVYWVPDVSWSENAGDVTWNSQPSVDTKASDAVTITTTAKYYDFDITGLVQARRAAGKRFLSVGVLPETTTSNAPDTFNSREATTNRPQLLVTP